MNIAGTIILNLILITFPILIYFIYNCYRELKCEKYNNILLNLSLFTSLYFCFKYGGKDISKITLFANIPILLAYLKKEHKTAIILSIITIWYTKYIYHHEVYLMIIKFICYFIIYLISRKKNTKENKFILIISIIQGFFISFEYYYKFKITNLSSFIELVVIMIIFYIVPFILLYLFNLTNNITNLYQTVSNLEKEKQVKNSLFKITHEVKNPIAGCKGYLEMINPSNQEQTSKYITIIKQELERSLNIMNDFMEFSKIKIAKEIIDINMLLDDISDSLKILIINKNIKYIYNQNEDERYIEGDYNRLKQVLINMLKNSIEAIKEEGLIEISSKEDNKYYYITIKDNGIGMNEYTLSKIKEMFFTTKRNGTGLGVTLSNEIIKSHNGELIYDSVENVYTKVTIKLPKYVL